MTHDILAPLRADARGGAVAPALSAPRPRAAQPGPAGVMTPDEMIICRTTELLRTLAGAVPPAASPVAGWAGDEVIWPPYVGHAARAVELCQQAAQYAARPGGRAALPS